MRVKSNYNFYITTDFAVSDKDSADYSVICVWAYNNNEDWFLVDGMCKRASMDVSLDELFRLVSIYKPLRTGIEITGQQAGFVSWIKREMINRNIFFNLAKENGQQKEGIRPTTNKMVRFQAAVPLFKAKKIYFPEEMKSSELIREAVVELSNASQKAFRSKHDDFIDNVSMLLLLDVYKPSVESKYRHKDGSHVYEDYSLEYEDEYEDSFNNEYSNSYVT
jgi:predicted phage terminase large subunit-like protein